MATDKHAGRALIILAAAALSAWPARAQGEQERFFDPENEVKHYESHLKLTQAQTPKVLEFLKQKLAVYKQASADRHRISKQQAELTKRIQKLNEELGRVDQKQKRSEEAVAAGIRGVLDDAQKKKFDAMEEDRRRQQREFEEAHRGGPGDQGGQGGPGGPEGPQGGPR